jgi:catechol 2,3-dioxygenase-like lactoylglutathione lyase family enzyme
MHVRRINRVELLLPGADIPAAVAAFNDVLGGHLPAPEEVPQQGVLSTADYALGIELYGPTGPDSPRWSAFDTKPRRGAVGPIVFEVDDLDAARAEVEDKGYRVQFAFGAPGVRQVHLDPERLFGYGITLTERASEGLGVQPTNVRRFQRVELLVAGEDIAAAIAVFRDVLGADMAPPIHIEEHGILTTWDLRLGIEIFGPSRSDSRIAPHLARKGRGAIGPIVFEVDDLDASKAAVLAKGYRVQFEFGGAGERQVHLDDSQLFGYGITFTERRAA